MKKLFLFAITLLYVQFARSQWEPDVRLTDTYDTSYLNYTTSHSIASDGDMIHVVWYEKTENNWEIFYMRSTDGGNNWGWGTRLTNTEGFSKYPCVSVSGPSVYVVWEESMEGNREVFFIRSLDGGENWEEASRLTEDPFISYNPMIASNESYIHIGYVIKDLDQQTWKVYYKHSTDGGLNWSTETWLSPNSSDAYNLSLAVSGTEVHFAWTDAQDGLGEIYYRKSSDNGLTWEPEIRLTNDAATQHMPSIAASGSSVNIAWHDKRNGLDHIYLKSSSDGGEIWIEDKQVTTDPTGSFNPNLAYSDSVLYLVWQNTYSGTSEINYNFSVDGGLTWNEETLLNDFSYSSQFPQIAVSGPVLHVIWYDYRNLNYEIFYKRNPTGGMVGVDEQLRAESLGLSVYPNPASRHMIVGRLDSWTIGQSAVGGQRSAVRLSIVDLFGREVKSIGHINAFPYQLDISNLTDGIYILKMTDESGDERSIKFIKINK